MYNQVFSSVYLWNNPEWSNYNNVNNNHDNNSLLSLTKIYLYFNKNKTDILKDHKPKKSGICMLYNKINNHFYIGSSINIPGRKKNYHDIKFFKYKRNANMSISKALLKNGYDNFSLIII